MMIVPGASVLRYSTAVRLNSGSNSTESSGSSPGWSPTSGCCAKLCETERIRPAAAITVQIRCRNFVIQDSPSSDATQCLHGLLEPSNLRDGAMASNPDIPLECFQFS